MKILIVYSTSEGQTAKIADVVSGWLRERGHHVATVDSTLTDENTEAYGFDAFILAGSVHFAKYQESLVKFAKRQAAILQRHPSAFLSVCGAASSQNEASQAEARSYIGTFISRTGWIPTVFLSVAGAVKYTKYNWLIKPVMKSINQKKGGPTDTTRDHELTDWVALKRFIDDFCDRLVEVPQRVSA